MRQDCCHEHPATYGGIFFDESGKKQPIERTFTHDFDYFSNKCLIHWGFGVLGEFELSDT